MSCISLKGCPFFNDRMPIDSGLGLMYKNKYCLDDFKECARYKVCVALGKENVPDNLYPNMLNAAEKLISK